MKSIIIFTAQLIYFTISFIMAYVASILGTLTLGYFTNNSPYSWVGGVIAFLLVLVISFQYLYKKTLKKPFNKL